MSGAVIPPSGRHRRRTDPVACQVIRTPAVWARIASGVLLADDAALRDIDEALETTERSSDDLDWALPGWTKGVALVHRVPYGAERDGGLAALALGPRHVLAGAIHLPASRPSTLYRTGESQARRPRRAVPLMREAVDELFERGQFHTASWGHRRVGGDAAGG